MIDNVQMSTKFSDQDFNNLVVKLGIIVPIDSEKVKFDWQNLRVVYYPNINKLTITNSLHKFYNVELNQEVKLAINHNDFTFKKVES